MFLLNLSYFFKYYRSLNEERCYQLINNQIPHVSSETKYVYESDQTILFMFKVTFKNAVMEQFCKQFNIKLVQNILYVHLYIIKLNYI